MFINPQTLIILIFTITVMMTMIAGGFVYAIIELKITSNNEQKHKAMLKEYELFINELSMTITNRIQQELVTIAFLLRARVDRPETVPDDFDPVAMICGVNNDIGAINNSMNSDFLQAQSLAALIGTELLPVEKEGIKATLDLERFDEDALDYGAKIMLYRIAKEAIRNVINHAIARHIEVILKSDGKHVSLSVIDDGIGINEEKIFGPPRHGFTNMRARAELLNAKLKISSAPYGGTKITVEMKML